MTTKIKSLLFIENALRVLQLIYFITTDLSQTFNKNLIFT